MKRLDTDIKNKVLASMIEILNRDRQKILDVNAQDIANFQGQDQALYDRLLVNDKKIDEMIRAVQAVSSQDDPVGRTISERNLENGLRISNQTAPFGTIMIIYESRPDVTIEAAVLAFKANNSILLKGGKEAIYTNQALVDCWHRALAEHDLSEDWIQLLTLNREETQEFLRNPPQRLDLIVPRGGERLIAFVKEHAQCAVLISGRGNNFAYIAPDADWDMVVKVAVHSKIDKISACNALDKILVDASLPNLTERMQELGKRFGTESVEILADEELKDYFSAAQSLPDEAWHEEFLAKKIAIGAVDGLSAAIEKINTCSGGHSAVIFTADETKAQAFMEQVDCAAVYHNASTRFTDGGQMGVGAELAISTDKLHHRGPLGLEQLVTNKYYVFGTGQIRE
ncbi:glutamate-5-semialdehyde dehydrogenase [Sphingobacterium corticis]|uniref:Gamma-glutamyl phosphate reductase n=1 Tax=Sphingobacterium corticis TaxID=1812823 RepID=A0ABW5NL76_9SPHI